MRFLAIALAVAIIACASVQAEQPVSLGQALRARMVEPEDRGSTFLNRRQLLRPNLCNEAGQQLKKDIDGTKKYIVMFASNPVMLEKVNQLATAANDVNLPSQRTKAKLDGITAAIANFVTALKDVKAKGALGEGPVRGIELNLEFIQSDNSKLASLNCITAA
ncbi:hypothetical protein BGX29_000234 [Mortierella sp. GBA35]|nr:hypothetical protein BGX29_000234 [Mortierella sp. GBA35]